ncbi:MAG TPA: gamma carbonic anhydrase family protein [Rhodocyclaceae bacterium]|nr:gamma carbonic anhydrase family protein [Rhodocyclaceae bacterium]
MTIYALGDRRPQCAPDAWVADNATVIGSVVVESEASVWFGVVIRGDNDLITIGSRTNVQDNAVLHTDAGIPLTLGREVTVGHQAMLHGCSVGDGSLIGIGAIVMNRAVIGRNSIVAAGALVPEGKTYPERSLILGSPAKVARQLSDEEVAALPGFAAGYVARAKIFRAQLMPLD